MPLNFFEEIRQHKAVPKGLAHDIRIPLAGKFSDGIGDVLPLDHLPIRENGRLQQRVVQLTHIPGPIRRLANPKPAGSLTF
jgi:hypothetical protein